MSTSKLSPTATPFVPQWMKSSQQPQMSAAWYYGPCEDESFDFQYEPVTPPLNMTVRKRCLTRSL